MKSITIFLSCFFSIVLFSQNGLRKLPEIKAQDFMNLKSSLEKEARAQILNDYGYTYFWENNKQIEHVFEKTTRIQILDKTGYDFGTIEIPIYIGGRSEEEVFEFTANIYNYENGKIIKQTVDKKALFLEKVNVNWNQMKCAFSNLKEGTIIEYSYKKTSPYFTLLPTWYFQYDVPVLSSKYKISLCPFYNYVILKKGFLKYDFETNYKESFAFTLLSQSYETQVYEWELKNVPSLKLEKFMTSVEDYRMKVEFQLESYYGLNGIKYELLTSWEDVIRRYLEDYAPFGGYIKSEKKEDKKIIEQLGLSGKSNHEKANIILDYVKKNYFWNGYNDNAVSQNKDKLIETKTGNAAEINLLLHSLMLEAGIDSAPILISTREHGKVFYQYPFVALFNYVAVMITDEKGSHYLDATNPLLPFGMLPAKCINEYCLQMKIVEKDGEAQFFSLIPTKKDLLKVNEQITINTNENLITSQAIVKLDGYQALNFRELIQDNQIDLVKNALTSDSQTKILNLKFENSNEVEKPLFLKYQTQKPVESIGSQIILTPFHVNTFQENVLNQTERVYPVDYGNLSDVQINLNLLIPEGYSVGFTPENVKINNADLSLDFEYKILITEQTIQIMVKLSRDKTKYEPENYKGLKAFYDSVFQKTSENIILKKN
uniref:hypothetical protein n=1 Tax=Flavobacterium sp. TaxID=239 RepID=UPI004049406E